MTLPLGSVRDANIDYNLWHEFLKYGEFINGVATTSTSFGPATLSAGYGNTAASTPIVALLAGTRRSAIQIASLGSTLSVVWYPTNVDNRWPIYVRHHWTSDAAVANVATFNTFYAPGTEGALTATPTTSLNVGIVTDPKAAAAAARAVTRWGAIAPLSTGQNAFLSLPATASEVTFHIAVSSVTNGAIGTIFVWYHALELMYTPRLTFGDGSDREARYANQILNPGPMEGGPLFSQR